MAEASTLSRSPSSRSDGLRRPWSGRCAVEDDRDERVTLYHGSSTSRCRTKPLRGGHLAVDLGEPISAPVLARRGAEEPTDAADPQIDPEIASDEPPKAPSQRLTSAGVVRASNTSARGASRCESWQLAIGRCRHRQRVARWPLPFASPAGASGPCRAAASRRAGRRGSWARSTAVGSAPVLRGLGERFGFDRRGRRCASRPRETRPARSRTLRCFDTQAAHVERLGQLQHGGFS